MKIAIGSDIHLEFGYIELENEENADVLVLAGDICVEKAFLANRCDEFFKKCSDEFEFIIYVLGNHEHYYGDINLTKNLLWENLLNYKNIHVLEDQKIVFKDTNFICSTLWTNLNNLDPLTEWDVARSLSDYTMIKNDGRKLKVRDTFEFFLKSHEFIKNSINPLKKNVIITHHAPSQQSICEKYKDSYHINGAFRSQIDDTVCDTHAELWIHGHTHHNVDYKICDTRVVSNQRGYNGIEKLSLNDSFKLKVIEI